MLRGGGGLCPAFFFLALSVIRRKHTCIPAAPVQHVVTSISSLPAEYITETELK